MPRGDFIEWATNANHPAGSKDWNGQPTKVEPPAGNKATGFQPEQKPPAEWFNWMLSELIATQDFYEEEIERLDDKVINYIGRSRLENWKESDWSLVSGFGANLVFSICPLFNLNFTGPGFSAIHELGDTLYSVHPGLSHLTTPPPLLPGGRGQSYGNEASSPVFSPVGPGQMRSSQGGTVRLAVCAGDFSTAAVDVYLSTVLGTWSLENSGIGAAKHIHRCELGHDTAICVAREGNVYRDQGLASPMSWTSPPGLTPTVGNNDYRVVRHSHDPSNDRWVYIDVVANAYSNDGLNWTTVSHSGFAPVDVAYSAKSQRWISIGAGGVLYISDDNGVTWSLDSTNEITNFHINNPTVSPFSGVNVAYSVHIESDDQDNWIITAEDMAVGKGSVMFRSIDNGNSWSNVTHPSMRGRLEGGVAFDGTRFATAGRDGALYSHRITE